VVEGGAIGSFLLSVAYTALKPWRKDPTPLWFSWRIMFCFAFAIAAHMVQDISRGGPILVILQREIPSALCLLVIGWNCFDYINYKSPDLINTQFRSADEKV
jgi:hypothetical protein